MREVSCSSSVGTWGRWCSTSPPSFSVEELELLPEDSEKPKVHAEDHERHVGGDVICAAVYPSLRRKAGPGGAVGSACVGGRRQGLGVPVVHQRKRRHELSLDSGSGRLFRDRSPGAAGFASGSGRWGPRVRPAGASWCELGPWSGWAQLLRGSPGQALEPSRHALGPSGHARRARHARFTVNLPEQLFGICTHLRAPHGRQGPHEVPAVRRSGEA